MITKGLFMKNTSLSILGLIFFIFHAKVIRTTCHATQAIFDVTKFGAKGNGKPEYNEDDESMTGMAFMEAWSKACNSLGPSKVVIPKGTFVVAQVLFTGPCQSTVTVDLQGNILADPDVSQFPNNELLVFQQVEGVQLLGVGSIDAKRPTDFITQLDVDKPFLYSDVMPSVSLSNVTKFTISGVKFVNPVAFHVLVDSSREVSISNVNFESTILKPVTRSDAIFVSMSNAVKIINSNIKTGDACVTVSGGTKNVSITGVTCANGKGISIGAQPHVTPDYNVNQVEVKNCTFKGTTHAAIINPRPQEALGQVSDITFEDLVLDGVQTPIFIKQDYLSTPDKSHIAKVNNVVFKNIRGTTTTKDALSISCSKTTPCDAIQVADVDFKFAGKTLLDLKAVASSLLSATCLNAKVSFLGKHEGLSAC